MSSFNTIPVSNHQFEKVDITTLSAAERILLGIKKRALLLFLILTGVVAQSQVVDTQVEFVRNTTTGDIEVLYTGPSGTTYITGSKWNTIYIADKLSNNTYGAWKEIWSFVYGNLDWLPLNHVVQTWLPNNNTIKSAEYLMDNNNTIVGEKLIIHPALLSSLTQGSIVTIVHYHRIAWTATARTRWRITFTIDEAGKIQVLWVWRSAATNTAIQNSQQRINKANWQSIAINTVDNTTTIACSIENSPFVQSNDQPIDHINSANWEITLYYKLQWDPTEYNTLAAIAFNPSTNKREINASLSNCDTPIDPNSIHFWHKAQTTTITWEGTFNYAGIGNVSFQTINTNNYIFPNNLENGTIIHNNSLISWSFNLPSNLPTDANITASAVYDNQTYPLTVDMISTPPVIVFTDLPANTPWVPYSIVIEYGDCSVTYNKDLITLNTVEQLMTKTQIYPNPVKDFFEIQLPDNISGRYTYKVYDMQGKETDVQGTVDNQKGIYAGHLQLGTYILHIQGDDGTMITKKLIRK